MRFLRFFPVVILLIVVFSSVGSAQPGGPDRPPDPDVPITGIEILIGLGGALGIRKLIIAKRNNPSEK